MRAGSAARRRRRPGATATLGRQRADRASIASRLRASVSPTSASDACSSSGWPPPALSKPASRPRSVSVSSTRLMPSIATGHEALGPRCADWRRSTNWLGGRRCTRASSVGAPTKLATRASTRADRPHRRLEADVGRAVVRAATTRRGARAAAPRGRGGRSSGLSPLAGRRRRRGRRADARRRGDVVEAAAAFATGADGRRRPTAGSRSTRAATVERLGAVDAS